MGSWTVISNSSRKTMSWGRKLGKLVQGGEIIGLVGELGTGKTTFTRGFAAGAGVGKDAWVRSPTFTLINEYQGRLPVYHIDLYRIGKAEEIDALNLREYLYSTGVSLIEWFEYLPAGEVDEHLEIKMAHAGRTGRELTLVAHGERYEILLKDLRPETDE
jgi:tRNA threonylcarbamoyladenosine biosynthesis protein TsaE